MAVAPRPLCPEDNWLEFIGAGVAGGFASGVGTDVYNDLKAICRAAVEKYCDPDPGEEGEYVHQIVAETFIGRCPPGHKLVHLNGIKHDNRLVNLAYVPKSDPRPAAPLKPRSSGRLAESAPSRKKRGKRKRKHR